MKVHEKIRFMRQSKGWSQEDMAEKLYMSVNGYANIERGETDIKLSRLQQVADVFEMDLLELFNFGEKNVVLFSGDNSSDGDNSCINSGNINNYFSGKEKELEHELEKSQLELEKSQLRLEQSEKEVSYLKEIHEKEVSYLKEIINLMKKETK